MEKTFLCISYPDLFYNIKGIGHDPLYKRYNSVRAAVNNYIPEAYRGFLAQADYDDIHTLIRWYTTDTVETPVLLSELPPERRAQYDEVLRQTKNAYTKSIAHIPDPTAKSILLLALSSVRDEFVFCHDNRVSLVCWGMEPNPAKKELNQPWMITSDPFDEKFCVKFLPGEHGRLIDKTMGERYMLKGTVLAPGQVPSVHAESGYAFDKWTPAPVGHEVTADVTFEASYTKLEAIIDDDPPEPQDARISFNAGPHGRIASGTPQMVKPLGATLATAEIPTVKADKGYKFAGWDNSVTDPVTGDTIYTATYTPYRPWWRRWWMWLVWLLLLWLLWLLLAWLFGWNCNLLSGCNSCGCDRPVDEESGIVYTDSVETDDGVVRQLPDDATPDDRKVILNPDTTLTGETYLPPYVDDNGKPLETIQDGPFTKVKGRLTVMVYGDVESWVREFMRISTPGENDIDGVNPEAGIVVIKVPEPKRDSIRRALPDRMRDDSQFDGDFMVVDDVVFESVGARTQAQPNTVSRSSVWHIDSVRASNAWPITKGNEAQVIAIIDDGLDITHPMFEGKIAGAYNIFNGTPNISRGEGHGTHVAGLAAGNDAAYRDLGISGVAPRSKVLPVQIFQGEMCSMMGILTGVNYALNHGAKVINLSLAPTVEFGLGGMTLHDQAELARTTATELEAVYNHLADYASSKGAILVWAVGNSNVMATVCPQNRTPDKTVNVAAVNRNIRATLFTNYNEGCNISAPGSTICSAKAGGGYAFMDGTSMAAPIVSGAVALMQTVRPELTAAEAVDIMQRTGLSTDVFVPRMLQVDLAVRLAQGYGDPQVEREVEAERLRRDQCRPAPPYGELDPEERYNIPRQPVETIITDDEVNRRDQDYVVIIDNDRTNPAPRYRGDDSYSYRYYGYGDGNCDGGVSPDTRPTPTPAPEPNIDPAEELRLLQQELNTLDELRKLNNGQDRPEAKQRREAINRRINQLRP